MVALPPKNGVFYNMKPFHTKSIIEKDDTRVGCEFYLYYVNAGETGGKNIDL